MLEDRVGTQMMVPTFEICLENLITEFLQRQSAKGALFLSSSVTFELGRLTTSKYDSQASAHSYPVAFPH